MAFFLLVLHLIDQGELCSVIT